MWSLDHSPGIFQFFPEQIPHRANRDDLISLSDPTAVFALLPGLRTGTSRSFVKLELEIASCELPWKRTFRISGHPDIFHHGMVQREEPRSFVFELCMLR